MKTTRLFRALGLLFLTVFSMNASAQMAEIRGTVTDTAGKPLDGVIVTVTYKGYPKTSITDEKGFYSIKPIEPGTYTVVFNAFGNPPVQVTDVSVSAEGLRFIDKQLGAGVSLGPVDVVSTSKENTIDMKKDPGIVSINSKDFRINAGGRDFTDVIVGIVPGIIPTGKTNKNLSIRGSREDATQVYIDGVKVYGSSYIPNAGVEDVTVISGGLPAKYGDTTSGVILITTKSYN